MTYSPWPSVWWSKCHFAGALIFGGSLFLTVANVLASNRLHHLLSISIIHAPLAFFDRTPIGRIVNRFASDVFIMDTIIARTIAMSLNTVIGVVSTVAVISLVTPVFLVAIIFLMIPFGFIQVSTLFFHLETIVSAVIVLSARFTQVAEKVGRGRFSQNQEKVCEFELFQWKSGEGGGHCRHE